MRFLLLFLVCAISFAFYLVPEKTRRPAGEVLLPRDTVIRIGGVDIWVQRPEKSKIPAGTLLLLPGWNYSFRVWCDSTNVCKTALEKGYTVVAPQMMRSIYATQYFPETRKDMRAYPTLTWLDSALDIMVHRHFLFEGKSYVLGLSTGARGVALICEKSGGFFSAAAALSGDYNQSAMPTDKLMAAVYGDYVRYADRWKRTDNPLTAIDSFKTPIYVGHGLLDKVVPASQSVEFYDSLYSRRRNAIKNKNMLGAIGAGVRNNAGGMGTSQAARQYPDIRLHLDSAAGHNFTYWRSELPAVWEFFQRH